MYIKKLITGLFLVLISLSVFAGNAYARETRSSQIVVLDPAAGEHKNFYLLYGENVEIRGVVNGDVYVTGGQVNVLGKINGDLLALGGNISISGEVTDDARVITQDFSLSGKIGKNLSVVSEIAVIENQGIVGGGIGSISSVLNIKGLVTGQVNSVAKEVNIENSVGGPIDLWVDSLKLGNLASISKDLNYHSDKVAQVSTTASVSGQVTRIAAPQFSQERNYPEKMSLPFKIIGFIGALLIGFLIIKFLPKYASSVLVVINTTALKSGLIGFTLLIMLPIVSFLLLITLVGIPLSILNIILYLLSLYLAKIFVSLWIGQKLLPNKKDGLRFGVGLLLYYIISIIPILGGIFTFIARMVGFGAIYISLKENLQKNSIK